MTAGRQGVRHHRALLWRKLGVTALSTRQSGEKQCTGKAIVTAKNDAISTPLQSKWNHHSGLPKLEPLPVGFPAIFQISHTHFCLLHVFGYSWLPDIFIIVSEPPPFMSTSSKSCLFEAKRGKSKMTWSQRNA